MRFEKAQDPHNTVRALARAHRTAADAFAGHPAGGRTGGSHRRTAEPLRSRSISIGSRESSAASWMPPRFGEFSKACSSASRVGRRLFGHGAFMARDQRHLDAGRSGRRSRPDDRLRFDRAQAAAGSMRALLRSAGARIPARRPAHDGRAGLYRSLELFLHQRRRSPALRLGGRRSRSRSESHCRRAGVAADVAAAGNPSQHRRKRETFR